VRAVEEPSSTATKVRAVSSRGLASSMPTAEKFPGSAAPPPAGCAARGRARWHAAAAAAVAEQREIARIVAASNRNLLDDRRHRQVGDGQDALGRAGHGNLAAVAERAGKCRGTPPRAPCRPQAASPPPRNQSASSRPSSRLASVTVGASPPRFVAGGPGHGPGAARPDVQAALVIEPGDRPSADADLEYCR